MKMTKNVCVFAVSLMWCIQSSAALYFHIGETERKCFIEEIPDETTVLVNYKVELYDPRSGGFMPSSPGIGMHVEVKDPDSKIILSRVYSFEGRISFTSHTPGEHGICLYSNSTKWIGGTQLRVHLDIQVGEHAIDYANVAQKDKLSELQLRIRQLLDQGPAGIGYPTFSWVALLNKGTLCRLCVFELEEEKLCEHQVLMYYTTIFSLPETAGWNAASLRVHLDIQVGEHAIDYANVAQKDKLSELQLRIRQLLDQVEQITKEQNYQRYREERFRQTSESTNQRVFWWSLGQLFILIVMGVWQMKHLKSFFEAKKLV